jgi:hypothetical protein
VSVAKIPVVKNKTSKLAQIFVQDTSVVTGAGLPGLVYNSVGLTWYYYVEGQGSSVQVSLQNMTLGTWVSGGFKEVDATNMPGWYQIGIPNAALALIAGGETVAMHIQGAVNMAPIPLELELVVEDDQTYSGLKKNHAFTAMPFTMTSTSTKLPVAGLTVTVQRKLDSGSFAVGGLTNITDATNGVYTVDGVASDSDGLYITFLATATGADPTIFTVITVP